MNAGMLGPVAATEDLGTEARKTVSENSEVASYVS